MTAMKTLTAAAVVALGTAGAAQGAEFVLAHGSNPGNPRYDAADMFAALVEQYSDGAMTVNVAPSATMGDDAEMLTSAQAGVIQMTANSQGAFSQIVPEAGALGLPFLFAELPAAWEVLDGPIGEELDQLTQERGLKIVTWWDNGIRHITHVDKAIQTPADIAGMKIRTPPSPSTLDLFEAVGANPAPLAWSELPTALRNGTFEGQENPLTNIHSARLHEITPHISMSAHKYEGTPVLASLSWWEGLSEEEQAIVQRAADEAGWYQRGRSMIDAVKLVAVLEEEGAQFHEVDIEAFKDATASVYDNWESELGDFVPRLREAAQEAAVE